MLKYFTSGLNCFLIAALAMCPAEVCAAAESENWQQLYKTGIELYSKRDYKGSEASLKQALEVAKTEQKNTETSRTLTALADLYRMTKRYNDAEPLYLAALDAHEKAGAKYEAAMDKNALAGLYKDSGKEAQSEKFYLEAIVELEKAKGKNDPSVAAVVGNLALLKQKLGKLDEAAKLQDRVLKIYSVKQADSLEMAQTLLELGGIEMQQKDVKKAAEHLQRSYDIFAKQVPADDLRLALAAESLGSAYYAIGLFSRAEDLANQTLAIYQKKLPADSIQIAVMRSNLGQRILRQKRADEALPHFEKSLAMQQKKLGKDDPAIIANLHGMAEAYAMKGDFAKCESVLVKILALKEAKFGKDAPAIVPALLNLAQALQCQSTKQAEGMMYYHRADSIREQMSPETRKNLEPLMRNELIPALTPQGQEARKQRGF